MSIDQHKEIRADHINAFVVPTLDILKRMGKIDATIKEIRRGESEEGTPCTISVKIEFMGDLKGTFIIRFEKFTACAIGATMMGSETIEDLDDQGKDALAELSNVIVGNATGKLANLGIRIMISPPSVSQGTGGPLTGHPFVVPLDSTHGGMEVVLFFEGK